MIEFGLNSLLVGLSNPSKSNENRFHLECVSLLISQPDLTSGQDKGELNKDKHYSFLCANPTQRLLFSNQDKLNSWKASLPVSTTGPTPTFKVDGTLGEIPFYSGWIGYFSYPSPHKRNIAEFNYYPWAICLDHHTDTFHLLGKPDSAAKEAFAWLLEAQPDLLLSKPSEEMQLTEPSNIDAPINEPTLNEAGFSASAFKAVWNKDEYQQAFQKIQSYLLAGDCYQVNLTQPYISEQYSGSPASTLAPLLEALKPSFGCYFQGQDCELISVSPERFISIDNEGKLEAKPIKGTIKRSEDPLLDSQLITKLLNSEKDLAENLMIVDLLRNDLSISALPGSVKVEKLFGLESQPNVHHLVSTITAQLKPGVSHADAIYNAFPGGSITGAPKVRAMEIINELEVQPRSLYCGSFGYFSDTGHTDFNILIRSLEFRDNTITCWGGGGITVESECDDEYEESITKIRRIMDTIENI
jgi:para-aminobenzoate synthetase component 1